MRNTTVLIAACTAALATVLGGVSFASAASEGAGGKTLRFVAVDSGRSDRYIDAGEPGEGPGDLDIFNEVNYRTGGGGKPIGHNEITCMFLDQGSARCDGTIFLREGKIEAGGAIHFRKTFRIPVLGGTGAYAGARGELAITELSDHRSGYVVRLLP